MTPEHNMPFPIIEKFHAFIAVVFACLGSLGMVVLLMSEIIGVIWNYFFNSPIIGIQDISSLSLVVIVSSSIYYCSSKWAHIRVDLLDNYLPKKMVYSVDTVSQLVSAFAAFIASYALFANGQCGADCGASTDNLYISHTPFYMLMALTMMLYGLHFFTSFIQSTARIIIRRSKKSHK